MSMMVLRTLRSIASHAKHQLLPTADVAAWRRACGLAAERPRYAPGEIAMNGFSIAYGDLLTLCPHWHGIFVAGTMRFAADRPDPRILDCGANIGLASLYFKRLYPKARITAFEADPALAAICRRNMTANGAADVEVEAKAVWREDGVVRFQREGADAGAIEGTSTGLVAAAAEVPAVRLRTLLLRERIDLLKVDIEGAEAGVLADCEGALDNVRAMLLDVHEFDATRRHTPEIMHLLARAGFLVSLSELVPLPWRASERFVSPFPTDSAAWAATLRAWRP
jgi:FkbM family methyltransferase